MHQLLALVEAGGGEDALSAAAPLAEVGGAAAARGRAALELLGSIRSAAAPAARVELDAVVRFASCLRRLARCATPPAAADAPAGGRRVQISDALGGKGHDLSRLPDLSTLAVPLAPAAYEGCCIDRYEDYYIPLPRSRPGGGGGDDGGESKLIICVDDSGVRHAQLLRSKPEGALDLRRDALVCAIFDELNTALKADSHARRRALRARAPRVLPLAPSAGLLEWCGNSESLLGYLSREHAKEHAAARETMSLEECGSLLETARRADAAAGASGGVGDAATGWSLGRALGGAGGGEAGAAAGGAGPATQAAWERIHSEVHARCCRDRG